MKSGEVISQLRKELGLSLAEVAASAGVEASDVEAWESGASFCPWVKALRQVWGEVFERNYNQWRARDSVSEPPPLH
jgi:transcriptional regulator with XRE-family HTH domain